MVILNLDFLGEIMTIQSQTELLDMAIALRQENRALKALVQAVLNDVKRTVVFPNSMSELVGQSAYDITIQRETLLKLLEVEGK